MTLSNEAKFVLVVVDVGVVGDKSLHETVRKNDGSSLMAQRAEVLFDLHALGFVEGFVLRLVDASKTHRIQSKPNFGSSCLEHVIVLVASYVEEVQPTVEPNMLTTTRKGAVADVFRETW